MPENFVKRIRSMRDEELEDYFGDKFTIGYKERVDKPELEFILFELQRRVQVKNVNATRTLVESVDKLKRVSTKWSIGTVALAIIAIIMSVITISFASRDMNSDREWQKQQLGGLELLESKISETNSNLLQITELQKSILEQDKLQTKSQPQ